jgi:ribose transport system ATP-binding protein
MSKDTPLLEMRHITKSFPGVKVLKGVDFTVNKGEIHSLMGANGAGKSTLIKILTGLYPADSGEIYIDGKEVKIRNRKDAMDAGISVIYQELSLIPTLSVTENVFLGQERMKGIKLNRRSMRQKVQELIDECHFTVKPDDVIESLSVAQQQTVEIMKALLNDAKLIIMDEPTASLNAKESESLFEIIRNLKKKGKSIIYISHRLEEVYEMSDRLTILRDGVVAAILDKQDIDPLRVVGAMLGHELKKEEEHQVHEAKRGGSVLEVENLSTRDLLDHISFKAYGGQILGIGGLVGSGRTDLFKCIFGLLNYSEGKITLDGKPVSKNNRKAIREGIGLVPEDRRTEGLVLQLDMTDNIALPNYDKNAHHGVVNPSLLKKQANKSIQKLLIHPENADMKCGNLSGGNQQKVVLAKWLERDLRVLLVDEPTVGIDIGAKAEIYEILRGIADKGGIVIVVSSDTEELLKISDRLLVLVNGHVFKDMRNEGITENDLMLASSGIDQKGESA